MTRLWIAGSGHRWLGCRYVEFGARASEGLRNVPAVQDQHVVRALLDGDIGDEGPREEDQCGPHHHIEADCASMEFRGAGRLVAGIAQIRNGEAVDPDGVAAGPDLPTGVSLGVQHKHPAGTDEHVVDVAASPTNRDGVQHVPAVLGKPVQPSRDRLLAIGAFSPRPLGRSSRPGCAAGTSLPAIDPVRPRAPPRPSPARRGRGACRPGHPNSARRPVPVDVGWRGARRHGRTRWSKAKLGSRW